jgi:hypothetical protein
MLKNILKKEITFEKIPKYEATEKVHPPAD